MFDVTLMKYFYDMERFIVDEDGGDLEAQIHEAFYIYCYKFLGTANEKWLHFMDDSKLYLKTPIYNYIGVSDEALTQWTIQNRANYTDDKLENKDKNVVGKGGRKKGVKTGSHESREKIGIYLDLFKFTSFII